MIMGNGSFLKRYFVFPCDLFLSTHVKTYIEITLINGKKWGSLNLNYDQQFQNVVSSRNGMKEYIVLELV